MSTGGGIGGAVTEALALEKGLREFYAFVASRAKGTVAKEMFEALRDMEDRHLRYLDFLYRAASEGRELMGYRDFSSKIAATHVESSVKVPPGPKLFDEKALKSNRDAVAHAHTLEARAQDLYRRLAEKSADAGEKAIFEEMVSQETRHSDYLKDLEKAL